jgi:hypothetical protein
MPLLRRWRSGGLWFEIPRDPISKNPSQKRTGGVAQGVDPEFKLQDCKKKKVVNNITLL